MFVGMGWSRNCMILFMVLLIALFTVPDHAIAVDGDGSDNTILPGPGGGDGDGDGDPLGNGGGDDNDGLPGHRVMVRVAPGFVKAQIHSGLEFTGAGAQMVLKRAQNGQELVGTEADPEFILEPSTPDSAVMTAGFDRVMVTGAFSAKVNLGEVWNCQIGLDLKKSLDTQGAIAIFTSGSIQNNGSPGAAQGGPEGKGGFFVTIKNSGTLDLAGIIRMAFGPNSDLDSFELTQAEFDQKGNLVKVTELQFVRGPAKPGGAQYGTEEIEIKVITK